MEITQSRCNKVKNFTFWKYILPELPELPEISKHIGPILGKLSRCAYLVESHCSVAASRLKMSLKVYKNRPIAISICILKTTFSYLIGVGANQNWAMKLKSYNFYVTEITGFLQYFAEFNVALREFSKQFI